MVEKKNIFENILQYSDKEIFENIILNGNLKIERIISYPNSTQDNIWYDQPQDEWVILLQGSATLELEDEKLLNLNPGDYLFLPSHTKHKVRETNKEEPTIWLAIHYK
ncbi:MAG: cupin domain-containing protein [Bacteroidetes bacterium]|nr:MAG: cupin domain-containing protein [Bacteroidota bacterium]